MEPTATAWVALGANLGDRRAALVRVREALVDQGLEITAASRELVTLPVGVTAQPRFRNQVVRLRSEPPLEPLEWLRRCSAAEAAAGRRPTYRWGPRRADADLLLLGDGGQVVVDLPELRVPHPAVGDRPFLCALLAELDPGLRHPDGWAFAERGGHFVTQALGVAGTPRLTED